MKSNRFRRLFPVLFGAVCMATALVGCGSQSPRNAYDSFRSAYESSNYAAMIRMLSKSAIERMGKEKADDAVDMARVEAQLKASLPPIEELKSAADEMINAYGANRKAELEGKSLHERLAYAVYLRKSQNFADKEKPKLASMNTGWALMFTVPKDDIGKRINTPREAGAAAKIEAKLQSGETLYMPLVQEDGSWKFDWPGK